MPDVAFTRPALPDAGALALLIGEGEAPSGLWAEADAATGGAIARALEVAEFTGKKHQVVTILAPGAGLSRVIAVGLGGSGDAGSRVCEEAGGLAAAAATADKVLTIATAGDAASAAHAAFGAVLRAWRFDRYRTKEKPEERPKLAEIAVAHRDHGDAKAMWPALAAVARGVFVARELVAEPGNVLTPSEFAKRCEGFEKAHGLEVEVLNQKDMRKLGFGALLGVARGSEEEPRLVVLRWQGAKGGKAKPVAFVGKGVTFDTGGISIKPAAGMEEMKTDMAGAAAVAGLMVALAERRAKVDAVGILGLVENMPSGSAQRPGDVVTSCSGQTIEVLNTDAEGRLVLADALWYCQDRFRPRFMINLATLTGAIVVALGHENAGLFSNDDELAERLRAAGLETGETVWRMPLGEGYDKLLRSDIADMKNIGGRPGGAVTAAQFLQRFVNGVPWAHLDIAGTAWTTKDSPVTPKGAAGFGVRLLERLVATHYEA